MIYALALFTGDRSLSPKLGIDLQGGTRVTLVPQGQEPTPEQLAQARTILERRVNGMGVSGASVVTDGNTLVITVPGEDASQARGLGQTSQLLFRPVAQAEMPNLQELPKVLGEMANRWVEYGIITPEQAKESTNTLITALNTAQQQPTIEQEGTSAEGEAADKTTSVPLVTAPEITATPLPEPANSIEATQRRQEITAILRKDRQSEDPTTQAAARSLMQCSADTPDPLSGTDAADKPLVTCEVSLGQALLLDPAPLLVDGDGEKRLSGSAIDSKRPITGGLNPQSGQMEISFAFDDQGGGKTWSKLTTEYLQKQVAITLDSQIISAPVIQSATPVGSATSITGSFTLQEAQELANNLRYGALPLSFAGENGESGGTTQTIPASLGDASLKAGFIAGIIGLILIAIFAFSYYRLYGLIAILGILLTIVQVYGSLVLLGRWIGYSLDLSGIAGLIIGIGAMADSFVVIYERIKDEVRDGATFRSATGRGWERAKRTIVTGNMVTLIASVAIYFLAVGEVKGFAFTLGMTTVFDLLVTFLLTAPIMVLAARRPFWAKPAVNGMAKVFRLAEIHRANRTSAEEAQK
nr:protein translocase subunit SecD [Corynebacterium caspium]